MKTKEEENLTDDKETIEPGDMSKVVIKPELAFKKSIAQELQSIKDLIIPSDDEYADLEFDNSLDLNAHSLSNLSDNAKRAIIDIIKQDKEYRINQQSNTESHKIAAAVSNPHIDDTIHGDNGTTFTPTKNENK